MIDSFSEEKLNQFILDSNQIKEEGCSAFILEKIGALGGVAFGPVGTGKTGGGPEISSTAYEVAIS